jgi:hypothetical protein
MRQNLQLRPTCAKGMDVASSSEIRRSRINLMTIKGS